MDLLMSQNFDYDRVNANIDPSKAQAPKDHFGFVANMLKPKK
jgi:hypothetical protein